MSEELFSYRVRRFRDENKLGQEELATALGVTARYIGMIERGQKDVEPSSSLHKLFCLLEENKIPLPVDLAKSHKPEPGHNGDRSHYKANGSTLSLRDALEQVRSDLETLEKGNDAQRRRTLTFLREVHLPILARALKIE
jgi:transcriptional regulator with XRE-family HTH domain